MPSDCITARTSTGLQIEVNDYHKACDNSAIASASEKIDNQQSGNIIQTCNCGIDSGNLSWSVQTTYESLMESDNSGNKDWRGLVGYKLPFFIYNDNK